MKAGGGGGAKDGSDGYHPMTPTNNSKTPFMWGILGAGHSGGVKPSNRPMFMPRLMFSLLVFICLIYLLYSAILILASNSFSHRQLPCSTTTSAVDRVLHLSSSNISVHTTPSATNITTTRTAARAAAATGLQHVVFGIAASASLWGQRKDYMKLWWRPDQMRGFVWLDKPVEEFNNSASAAGLPPFKLSGDTARFPYTHKKGSRSAIRISRIVSETYRLGLDNVRWFVMGDDDTVFVPDNLVRVLSQFDHRQPYYIGSVSESHLQNIYFSYGMPYGGGGFAISRPSPPHSPACRTAASNATLPSMAATIASRPAWRSSAFPSPATRASTSSTSTATCSASSLHTPWPRSFPSTTSTSSSPSSPPPPPAPPPSAASSTAPSA